MTDCANCDGYAADLSVALNRAVRLRARLAAVEAERDDARESSLRRLEANIDLRARAEAAEARLAAVEALAKRSFGLPVCGEEHLAKLVLLALRGEGDR